MTAPVAGTGNEFGAELRRRRLAARWSLTELAAAVHYSKGYLSKIESGAKPANPDLARRCDVALGAHGDLTAMVPPPVAVPQDSGHRPEDDEVWIMTLDRDGAMRFQPVPRRDALRFSATCLLGLGTGIRSLSAAARQDTTLELFGTLFDQSRRLGQALSPRLVLPSVVAHTNTVRALAAATEGPARIQALELAARFAEYAGWMAQESGQTDAALWWTSQAVDLAAAAGNTDMAAYGLVRRALVALYHDDAVQTVQLAQQAQADSRVPHRIRGLAAQREAQGHALIGDYDRCRRSLDTAGVLLRHAAEHPLPGPVIGTSTVSDPVALTTGWCLYDLGHVRQAAEVLDREMGSVPTTARRAWARYAARRALAYASAGEVEHACALTGQVVDAMEVVDSATIRQDLVRLARTLGRWQGEPAVRGVRPQLIAVLRL